MIKYSGMLRNFCLCIVILISAGMVQSSDMNSIILDIIKTYPTDSSYGYSWPKKGEDGNDPYDGVTQDIYYGGDKILKGDGNNNSYCCGLTLEVFLKSIDKYNQEKGTGNRLMVTINDNQESIYNISYAIGTVNKENFSNFKYLWFCPELNSAGPGEALVSYGMGTMVRDWREAKSGDFVQFWRWNKSGHSAIFIEWVKDSTDIVNGFKYWSSQGKGIGYRTAYFGDSGRAVNRQKTFLSRVTEPKTWNLGILNN